MADEPDVQSTEITLDDFNADEPAKAAPSPAKEEAKADPEPKVEESKDSTETKEEAKGDDTPAEPDVPIKTDTEDKSEDKPEDKVEETVEQPTKADERKTQLNTEIRDLVAQRNALKTEVEKINAEVYQVATEDELVEQGLSATDAKVENIRQQMELKDYNDRVAEAQLTLSSESDRVLRDFPQFNPDNENFDKELASDAAQLLADNLIIDENTKQIIGSNISPYQLYKTLARASGVSETKGQIKGQKAAAEMAANADEVATIAPEKKPEDPLMALWTSDD